MKTPDLQLGMAPLTCKVLRYSNARRGLGTMGSRQ